MRNSGQGVVQCMKKFSAGSSLVQGEVQGKQQFSAWRSSLQGVVQCMKKFTAGSSLVQGEVQGKQQFSAGRSSGQAEVQGREQFRAGSSSGQGVVQDREKFRTRSSLDRMQFMVHNVDIAASVNKKRLSVQAAHFSHICWVFVYNQSC